MDLALCSPGGHSKVLFIIILRAALHIRGDEVTVPCACGGVVDSRRILLNFQRFYRKDGRLKLHSP